MNVQDALDRLNDLAHEAHLEHLANIGSGREEARAVALAKSNAYLDALDVVRKIHAEEES